MIYTLLIANGLLLLLEDWVTGAGGAEILPQEQFPVWFGSASLHKLSREPELFMVLASSIAARVKSRLQCTRNTK